jgi:large subunit ribosomal protein L1
MSKRGKRYQKATESLDPQTFYSLDDALLKIKESASAKFDETIDVAINWV